MRTALNVSFGFALGLATWMLLSSASAQFSPSSYGLQPDYPKYNQHLHVGGDGALTRISDIVDDGLMLRIPNNVTHIYGRLAHRYHGDGLLCDIDGDSIVDPLVDVDGDGVADVTWNVVALSVDPDAGGQFRKIFKMDYLKPGQWVHRVELLQPAVYRDEGVTP